MNVNLDYISSVTGFRPGKIIDFNCTAPEQAVDLLRKMGFHSKVINNNELELIVPFYRAGKFAVLSTRYFALMRYC